MEPGTLYCSDPPAVLPINRIINTEQTSLGNGCLNCVLESNDLQSNDRTTPSRRIRDLRTPADTALTARDEGSARAGDWSPRPAAPPTLPHRAITLSAPTPAVASDWAWAVLILGLRQNPLALDFPRSSTISMDTSIRVESMYTLAVTLPSRSSLPASCRVHALQTIKAVCNLTNHCAPRSNG